MNKFQHTACNDVLGAPYGVSHEECTALPVFRSVENGVPCVVSFWKPDAQELAALNSGRAVALCIQGRTHPPIKVGVATHD